MPIVPSIIVFAAAAFALEPPVKSPAEPPVRFTDVTRAAGIDFVETIGDDEMSNIVEATGVGCGFLDFDGDGWMDIYFVNGCWKQGLSDPKIEPEERRKLATATDRLYRNRGDGTFEDITAKAGITKVGYGMAVVVADYDGDGDPDIYVTNYGPNFLYRNNGDGTFAEVAKAAGVDDPLFSVGAVFFDYDRDGRLDLYVGNYLTYVPDPKRQHTADGVRSPLAYEGQQDRLFRGNLDGTFTDVTAKAGIVIQPVGRAMGIGTIDYDNDGLVDVFVSNDAMENFLLHNKGDGTFEDEALLAGVAFGETGDAAAAMAVEVADYDGDGLFDILVPDMNLCCLYHNMGGGMFEDLAVRSGITAAVLQYHSWGGILADFDLDSHPDAYIANGSACLLDAQPNALFINSGQGRFVPVTTTSGGADANRVGKFVSRGVARGDFDNDGDVDLLIVNLNDRPTLLRNDTPGRGRHWLQVNLVGREPNRDAIGAVVRITLGDRTLVRHRASAGSYLSQHDPRIHFGLGGHGKIDRLEVTWPDGSRQAVQNVPTDRILTIRQRAGSPAGRANDEAATGLE
ncbi:MAG: CRTAC1 family protein [Phycisphaerae bacterium]|nr:CRTAC1 family protein [Phycisphaerae bacterium]